jgi:hypothetical protein
MVASMLVFAVGCTEMAGHAGGVVLYTANAEQAFEAAEEVLREQVLSAAGSGQAGAFGQALSDLLSEGVQEYGWWAEVDGCEVWYGPVSVDAATDVGAGEVALLASVTSRGGVHAAPGDAEGEVVADLRDRRAEARRAGVASAGSVVEVGLGGQCRADGPDLRAGRLAVAVHPHGQGGDAAHGALAAV